MGVKKHLTEEFQSLFANTSSLEGGREGGFLGMCVLLNVPRRSGVQR